MTLKQIAQLTSVSGLNRALVHEIVGSFGRLNVIEVIIGAASRR